MNGKTSINLVTSQFSCISCESGVDYILIVGFHNYKLSFMIIKTVDLIYWQGISGIFGWRTAEGPEWNERERKLLSTFPVWL